MASGRFLSFCLCAGLLQKSLADFIETCCYDSAYLVEQEHSYHQQNARQLRTQYAEGIY